MTLDTRIRWLKFATIVTIGFGIVIAVAAIPALAAPTAMLADLIFFPVDGAPAVGAPADRLLAAITGGVMTGWGVMMYMIVTGVLAKDPALGRRIILAGMFAWYAVDSSMSLAAGAPLNVASNTVFLLLFVVPVWSINGTAAVDAG